MAQRNRIPTALEPYLRLPVQTSLILLTSTLGCSVNWVTARFAGSVLSEETRKIVSKDDGTAQENIVVVLVSWMRDAAFWKTELRRTMGIDIAKAMSSKRYTFVDCFTPLAQLSQSPSTLLALTEQTILRAVDLVVQQSSCKVLLVLDAPDVMLALNPSLASHELSLLLLNLRGAPGVHATVISCSADLPLLSAAAADAQDGRVPTSLEERGAGFVVQQAHNAALVMGVRELETGAARDVSGVLRVTRGSSFAHGEGAADRYVETEKLYLVQRDGSASVFERGAGA